MAVSCERTRRTHAIRVAKELTGGVGPVGGHEDNRSSVRSMAMEMAEIRRPTGRLVILTDVDGTLLRSDGTASARTVGLLPALARRGHHLLLVTGRAVRDLDQVGMLTGHRGLTVCANGAAIYDHAERRVRQTRPFGPVRLHTVISTVARQIPDIILAVEDLLGLRFVEGFPFRTSADGGIPVAPVSGLRGVLQILAWHPWLAIEELVSVLGVALAGQAETSWGNGLGVVELNVDGVNKGTTAAGLVAGMGLTSDSVIAFGDMPNDLPMLRWAGAGFAMANAHPSVLAAVEHRAPNNDDDGFARVLEKLLGIGPT